MRACRSSIKKSLNPTRRASISPASKTLSSGHIKLCVETYDGMSGEAVQWRVVVKRSKIKAMREGGGAEGPADFHTCIALHHFRDSMARVRDNWVSRANPRIGFSNPYITSMSSCAECNLRSDNVPALPVDCVISLRACSLASLSGDAWVRCCENVSGTDKYIPSWL